MISTLILLFLTPHTYALDCKATSELESVKAVCKSQQLKDLDTKLNDAYKKAKADSKNPDLVTGQRLWLEWLEKYACNAKEDDYSACLQKAYEARIKELNEKDFGYEKKVLKSYSIFDTVRIKSTYPGPVEATVIEFHSSLKNAEKLNELFKDYSRGVAQSVSDDEEDHPNSEEVTTEILGEGPEYVSALVTSVGFFGGVHPMHAEKYFLIDVENAKEVAILSRDLLPKKALALRKKIFNDAICDRKGAKKDPCLQYFCGVYTTEVLDVTVRPGPKESLVRPPLDLPPGLFACENQVTQKMTTETLMTYYKPDSASYKILQKMKSND